jgi:RNA polymerase sigma-70 factor (ECF subfamily)
VLSEESDEALLAAYRGGNVAAFETLLGRYRRPLFNVVLRTVRDRGRAEEVYQDVWVKVVERSEDFRGDAKFSTWLYAIARNVSIDHLRKQRHRNHASLDAPAAEGSASLLERVAGAGPTTEQLAGGALLGARLVEAVEALPDEQREVFVLRQVQGLAFVEIAEVVGTSTNTVKSRMRYALERLRDTFADWKRSNEL